MRTQDKMLKELAKEFKIPITIAEEIYKLFTQQVAVTISAADKKNNEFPSLYDPIKFTTIHMDQFGKFVPNYRNIRHANYCIKNKEKYKNNKKIKNEN